MGEWIPSITGLEEKLKVGGKVADIGCGFGTTSILMDTIFMLLLLNKHKKGQKKKV